MKGTFKSGISLIAVLLFMLAATTASIVIFRWISQENFSSGARLKGSEAYQASQAGLEAVQGWLANKGADAGALIKVFEEQTGAKNPVLLVSNTGSNNLLDLLAGTSFSSTNRKNQKFEVYLTNVNTEASTYKLKFLSIGTARDGSKHSQVGIFDVVGLYKTTVSKPAEISYPDIPAFFGGIQGNTQGRFESAIINGDLNVNGLSTQGDLIVTGNMSVMDNGEKFIGCKSNTDSTRAGDMYVFGNVHLRGFRICGDAYIGGQLRTLSGPRFLKNLYAAGGIYNESSGLVVRENLTLGGDLTNPSGHTDSIYGNFVIEPPAQIVIADGSVIRALGSIWSMNNLFKTVANNGNNNDKYGNITMGSAGKSLFIPSPLATNCAINNDQGRNCGNNANRWFQTTGASYAHFTSYATHVTPSLGNKPEGANLLTSMAEQITDCEKPGGGTYKCVPDPLEVPEDTRDIWLARGKRLDTLVNILIDTLNGLPKACIRLARRPQDPNGGGNNPGGGYDSYWGFGDALPNGSTRAFYPSMGDGTGGTCNGTRQYNFIKAANDCYAGLIANGDPKGILYQNGELSEKFLPLSVKNPGEKSPCGHFDGKFIFAYEQDMGSTMKLPPTTNNTSVFIYFKEGATANMPLENGCSDLTSPCKRNYFIFSEKDIAGSSGTATINGAIFLANGSKITGQLPDAGIEFNPDLYKDLVNAGIIKATDASLLGAVKDPPVTVPDVYHVPSTSHLKVKLESQYANVEDPSNSVNARPAVLVLPRVIYLNPGEISNPADLQKYYRVLYLNGATKPATEAMHSCPPDVLANGAMNTPCTLNSTSTTCNGSDLCRNHPFYVVIAAGSSSSGDLSSSSDGAASSSSGSNVTLTCGGLASNTGIEGTAIPQPTLVCSNTNASPQSGTIAWNPPVNWSNPAPGTYNNITATATCGTETVISNSCGNLTVESSVTLNCSVNGTAKAGTSIDAARRTLVCSNGVTATNISYTNINWSNPTQGNYSNIRVTADCGNAAGLLADCTGTLMVVDLTCITPVVEWAKPGSTISTPVVGCRPSPQAGNPSAAQWTKTPNFAGWTMPSSASGTQYTITASATCSGINDLAANCGVVKIAGIACTGLPGSVKPGGTIPVPNLACNNGSNATNRSYKNGQNNIALPYNVTSGTAIGTSYNISATADCGTITGLTGSCGTVTVANCDYDPSWCGGRAIDQVTTGSAANNFGTANGCIFIKSAGASMNTSQQGTIYVNGVQLTGADIHYNAGAINNMAKADGGYYIYFPGNQWYQTNVAETGTPACGSTSSSSSATPSSSSVAPSSSSAGGACVYQSGWCNRDISQVTTGSAANNFGTANGCIFIKSAGNSMNTNQQGTIYINGVQATGADIHYNAGAINNRAKADGGYYIYFPGNQWYQTNVAETGTPDCGGGTPSSSSAAASSSSAGGGGGSTAVCNGNGTNFGAGSHTISVASGCSGGQLLCWGSDGVTKTVTFNGQARNGDALKSGNSGWVESWGISKPVNNATLVVSAGTVNCRTDW